MKIAVSIKENAISDHFGHCDSYSIFSVGEKGNIVNTEILPAEEGCGCKSNMAEILSNKGVKVLLAGNMGNGAYTNLNNAGIRVYRGCSGDIQKLVDDYIQGKIIDNVQSCDHHSTDEHHSCQH